MYWFVLAADTVVELPASTRRICDTDWSIRKLSNFSLRLDSVDGSGCRTAWRLMGAMTSGVDCVPPMINVVAAEKEDVERMLFSSETNVMSRILSAACLFRLRRTTSMAGNPG